jgi:hypothetical protein
MHSLRDLQQGFMQAVFSRNATAFAQHLVPGGLSGEQRVAVYRNNTFTNLQNAMQSAYPVVTRLVGEGFFSYAATEYIYHYPSSSGDLHDYGSEFAEFLQDFAPVSQLLYLPDVARLEWACHTAFFAADHVSLDLQSLTEVPVERYGDLSFKLHPACRLLESSFPVDSIWHVNQEDFEGEQNVDLALGGVRLLIRRPRHHVDVVPLSDGEWRFLNSLASGETLGTACEMALSASDEFELGKTLQRFVSEATLVDFTLP